MSVLPDFYKDTKSFKSTSVDAKGTVLTIEIEEKGRFCLDAVVAGLDKANAMSKEAGTDVAFALNRKDLKFAPVTENTIVVPISPLDDAGKKSAHEALKVLEGVKDVDVRDAGNDLLVEITLVPGKSLSLADVDAALEKIKGASVRLNAVQVRMDGTITSEQAQ